MSDFNYLIVPNSEDGVTLPITPHAVPVEKIGEVLRLWLGAFIQKGQPHFSNCKQERIPLEGLGFTLVPVEVDDGEQNDEEHVCDDDCRSYGCQDRNAPRFSDEVREWSGE